MAAVSALCQQGYHVLKSFDSAVKKGCMGTARDIDLTEGWGHARYHDHPCQCDCHGASREAREEAHSAGA